MITFLLIFSQKNANVKGEDFENFISNSWKIQLKIDEE